MAQFCVSVRPASLCPPPGQTLRPIRRQATRTFVSERDGELGAALQLAGSPALYAFLRRGLAVNANFPHLTGCAAEAPTRYGLGSCHGLLALRSSLIFWRVGR